MQIQKTATAIGKTAPAQLLENNFTRNPRFQAILTATAGQVASCTVRPLAAETPGHAGFPIGGQVSLSGTADGNGFVAVDGFPFVSTFPFYGFEVQAISGTGASVNMIVAA
jgi:hypothetical protein